MKPRFAKTRILRKALIASIAAVVMAALSPAVLAGGHGRHGGYHGSHGFYGYAGYGYASYGHHGYRHARRYSYRAPRRYYPRYHRWGPGEVLGAVVAGAIITNVIADAFEPRTTVIERRVYRSSYPDYSDGYYRQDRYNTRYVGRDDSYYERRR